MVIEEKTFMSPAMGKLFVYQLCFWFWYIPAESVSDGAHSVLQHLSPNVSCHLILLSLKNTWTRPFRPISPITKLFLWYICFRLVWFIVQPWHTLHKGRQKGAAHAHTSTLVTFPSTHFTHTLEHCIGKFLQLHEVTCFKKFKCNAHTQKWKNPRVSVKTSTVFTFRYTSKQKNESLNSCSSVSFSVWSLESWDTTRKSVLFLLFTPAVSQVQPSDCFSCRPSGKS